ncbi:enoyl-CoA hydratase/isomerase family protein [Rhodococcus sp. CX]|uniref:enoyl-CoA hydratase/isomerase family protein n=1 Tax=Rhodococcus sp. CX TaxID=2789880 RepID=UPI0018CE9F38|nr:enoyl-CoA hydratase/isomerase family protein [Rhodococcus sp. CX]MBH0119255.1 enoyl-CoA hydratase/isomerase family protein [Rhodococcus sp. CX]
MSEVRFGSCGYTVAPLTSAATNRTSPEGNSEQAEVWYVRQGSIGRIILNRPKALNALTISMVHQLHLALDEWEADPGSALVLESSSPKAFCAGGDIRQIRQNTVDGAHHLSEEFFSSEYRLNARLASLHTPLVSLIDGICMGGGMGLSVHGAFRVVSDKAVLAMPETAIGFFPDVGGSYFLSRLPGALGTYLGLTGYRMDAADAVYTGLATHRVPEVSDVVHALGEVPQWSVDEVLRALAPDGPTAPPKLAGHRDEIDWCFGAPTVAEIRTRLTTTGGVWAKKTLGTLGEMSPQSLEVTLAAITAGKQQNLEGCLQMELRIATHLARTSDFVEGVRAGLVDKDRSPKWTDTDFDYSAAGLWNRLS